MAPPDTKCVHFCCTRSAFIWEVIFVKCPCMFIQLSYICQGFFRCKYEHKYSTSIHIDERKEKAISKISLQISITYQLSKISIHIDDWQSCWSQEGIDWRGRRRRWRSDRQRWPGWSLLRLWWWWWSMVMVKMKTVMIMMVNVSTPKGRSVMIRSKVTDNVYL